MSKISLLPVLDPAQIDGSETVPVVKAGLNRRVSLTALISALVQPFINTAKGWADAAAASAAALGITTQTTNDVVHTDQDANGRWWTQHRLDGTFRVQKLADARGNRLNLAITANATRLGTAEGWSIYILGDSITEGSPASSSGSAPTRSPMAASAAPAGCARSPPAIRTPRACQ